ncbi:MAG: hypothetical protein M1830_008466 [Pleopsidium flavum]|nr:MAG: hypothetical protein M1830_008466 [Pleopsidium flavum]
MPSATSDNSMAADVADLNAKLDALIMYLFPSQTLPTRTHPLTNQPPSALEAHPSMNRTNPVDSNKSLFFTWDFVQRTRHNLSKIDIAKLAANDPTAGDEYMDVIGRASLSNMIISDTSGEMMKKMTGEPPLDFGPDARAKAAALVPESAADA